MSEIRITWALLEQCADRKVSYARMAAEGIRYASWFWDVGALHRNAIRFGIVGDQRDYRLILPGPKIEVEVPVQTTMWVSPREAAERGVTNAFAEV